MWLSWSSQDLPCHLGGWRTGVPWQGRPGRQQRRAGQGPALRVCLTHAGGQARQGRAPHSAEGGEQERREGDQQQGDACSVEAVQERQGPRSSVGPAEEAGEDGGAEGTAAGGWRHVGEGDRQQRGRWEREDFRLGLRITGRESPHSRPRVSPARAAACSACGSEGPSARPGDRPDPQGRPAAGGAEARKPLTLVAHELVRALGIGEV